MFGLVNLFADMPYEGARSVTGPFLATLGASGLVVGAITGFGELLGYSLRFATGRLADRSRLYWPITLIGYLVQMVAAPALALAGNWPLAMIFIIMERVGKATRKPPRDVMLSQAGEHMGLGWAFGVNEALDQLGAFVGPLAGAAVLARGARYTLAFAMLAIPALATLALLLTARLVFPRAGHIEKKQQKAGGSTYPPAFWWYMAAAAMVGFGFADYSLIAFHFSKGHVVPPTWIPIFYALSMGAGGLGSLLFGRIFDRVGLIVLVPITFVVAAYAPLAFLGGFTAAMIGAVLWGVGLGAHESIMQAAVAHMIPRERLGAAYGLFGAAFGVAWFGGSAALGALYDVSIPATVALAVIAQLLAIVPLVIATGRLKVS